MCDAGPFRTRDRALKGHVEIRTEVNYTDLEIINKLLSVNDLFAAVREHPTITTVQWFSWKLKLQFQLPDVTVDIFTMQM